MPARCPRTLVPSTSMSTMVLTATAAAATGPAAATETAAAAPAAHLAKAELLHTAAAAAASYFAVETHVVDESAYCGDTVATMTHSSLVSCSDSYVEWGRILPLRRGKFREIWLYHHHHCQWHKCDLPRSHSCSAASSQQHTVLVDWSPQKLPLLE